MQSSSNKLDATVQSIELTLISIIQGVALYFLVESSRTLVLQFEISRWPYIFTALLVLFLFWSRAMLHTLTVIHWPLEFGHNFLYIVSTFLEAIGFTQVGNPLTWFLVNTVYALLVWVLFLWDLKMVHHAMDIHQGREGQELFSQIRKEQMQNIVYWMPATILFNLAATLIIYTHSQWALERNGHLILIGLQAFGALIYLSWSLRFYRTLIPAITRFQEK